MPVDPAEVTQWLGPLPPDQAGNIDLVCAAVNEYVAGLDWVASAASADPAGAWPERAELGALMLVSRYYRRRNTPSGIESVTDVVTYTARTDVDVAMMLRIGQYQIPAVG